MFRATNNRISSIVLTASLLALLTLGASPVLAAAAAPSSLAASPISTSQINLTWVDNSTNTSNAEDGFKVERATSATGPWTAIATTGPDVTLASSTGLTEFTTYYYRVLAFSSAKGDSTYSNTANATTLASIPSPPSSLAAAAVSATQINLTWTDSSSNESGFKIERASSTSGPWSQIALVGAGVASYSNTGLTATTAYSYRVRSYNTGGDSTYSNAASATTLATLPAAPTNLHGTVVSTSQVNLTWTDASNNESGFKVYRATASAGPWTLLTIVSVNVTSYSSTKLNAYTTYYYHVDAFNVAGTAASAVVSATTPMSTTAPLAPTTLTAAPVSSSQINLTWVDASNDENGFAIERATTSAGPYTQIGTVAPGAVSFSSSGLTAGTAYYYRVRAYNANGNSGYSNTANATTSGGSTPPAAPSGLSLTVTSSSQINLSWVDNATTESGFKIERATSAAGPWTQVALAGANVNGYSATGLSGSTAYYFRVRSYNTAGDSAYSNTASATTQAVVVAPSAPTSLAATATSSSQINLSWADTSSNETGFKIEQAPASSGPWTQRATAVAGSTSYSDSGLIASTAYYYRVRSYNTAGDSAYSNTANATTQAPTATIPAAPTNLVATAGSSSQISLTWTDASTNETGFQIERAASAAGPWGQIGTSGANVALYTNTGLTASTTYYYRVRSSNTAGNSGYSNTASATTAASTPTPGAHIWSKRFGGTLGGIDYTNAESVASDSTGNLAIAGSFYGTLDLGGIAPVLSGGGYDGFVAKYSSSGTPIWLKKLGGNLTDYAHSVAMDSSGNVIVAGEFQGTANFGCSSHSNPAGYGVDIFVVKLAASNGACIWSKSYGDAYRDVAYGVATDGSGNVLVTGGFYANGDIGESVDFGGVPLSGHYSANARPDIFVLKLGSDGRTLWARGGFGGSADDMGRSVAADGSGNVLVTGEFFFGADFGAPTAPLTNGSDPDVFVMKFSAAGDPLWAKQYGSGPLEQRGTDIAVDAGNNVFVGGWFRGSINFGGGSVTVPAGSSGLFLAKLGPAGDYQWQKTFQDSDYLRYPSVAVDSGGNVALSSSIRLNVNFGGGALTTTDTYAQDLFVAKYRADGSHIWSKRFTGTNESSGCDIASVGTNVVVTGWITGTVDFGGGSLVNGTNGVRASALVKFGP